MHLRLIKVIPYILEWMNMNMMYEKRREELWKYAGDNTLCTKYGNQSEDSSIKVKYKQFDYFVPIKPSESPVSGFKAVPETSYDRKVYTSWVKKRFDEVFLLKGKKTFRKKYLSLKPYQEYNVSSLQLYLEQALSENTKYMLISWQEYNMLESGEVRWGEGKLSGGV